MKVCSKCKIQKAVELFPKDKSKKDGFHPNCKDCFKKYSKINSERKKEYNKIYRKLNEDNLKQYYHINKEQIIERIKKYNYNRRKTDYLFNFTCNVRSLIRMSFKRGNNHFKKKSRTEDILGCSIEEFKKYIESKFTEGMSFKNYGKWHLDHIKPISLATTEEEVIELNHYTNFQPLWAIDNFKKGAKY